MSQRRHPRQTPPKSVAGSAGDDLAEPRPSGRLLEVVLKADALGTLAALEQTLGAIAVPGVEISIIRKEVGDVSKADLLMAQTGDHLVFGFQVQALPRIPEAAREQGIEVRLYDVIYRLARDAESIARSFLPQEVREEVLGRARTIALFKSSRKGIILGCEVERGRLAVEDAFRVVSPMGPVYEGRVESLKIRDTFVREARPGQQVGIKIRGFQEAQVGDVVETFRVASGTARPRWSPRGGVHSYLGR